MTTAAEIAVTVFSWSSAVTRADVMSCAFAEIISETPNLKARPALLRANMPPAGDPNFQAQESSVPTDGQKADGRSGGRKGVFPFEGDT
ncbi:hypothetical protein DM450_23145 (plasmid) [Sphingomonas sp. IC081]|nr:hypothetical protein DM450_23145 [Sphingomonas sp. IC081]